MTNRSIGRPLPTRHGRSANPYESPVAIIGDRPAAKLAPVVCAVIVILGNLASGCYLALVFWLMGTWMIDDSLAFRLASGGWVAIAIQRLAVGLLAALVIGLLSAVGNRVLFTNLFPERRRLHWLLAGAPGWMVALGSIIGSIQFLIEKPFM